MSHVTIGSRLKEPGYKSGLPSGTPMFTAAQKVKRVEWATKNLNNRWKKTLISDKTAFQLFRNTIAVWYKRS